MPIPVLQLAAGPIVRRVLSQRPAARRHRRSDESGRCRLTPTLRPATLMAVPALASRPDRLRPVGRGTPLPLPYIALTLTSTSASAMDKRPDQAALRRTR
jgi:hypothetical protein